jgi:hypothetical protein
MLVDYISYDADPISEVPVSQECFIPWKLEISEVGGLLYPGI